MVFFKPFPRWRGFVIRAGTIFCLPAGMYLLKKEIISPPRWRGFVIRAGTIFYLPAGLYLLKKEIISIKIRKDLFFGKKIMLLAMFCAARIANPRQRWGIVLSSS